MKVTVERAQLLRSLGHVHRVVERRNTIPILANVLIRADEAKLALKATDLDLEVIETIPAEVGPAGATTVPAHMFYDIVRKLPEGTQILLEASGDRASLALRAGRSRFSLQTLPESDFPDLAAGEMTHKFALAAKDLKRLIDGTFPDYSRVIPVGNDKQLTIDKADFAAAVDRVSTVSSERGRAVKLALSGSKLVLSVTNPDSGSATEELEVEYDAEPLDIGFNSRYLLDIAGQIEGESAVLKLAAPGSPTLIEDRDAKDALYVLMPMRV